MEDKEMLAKPVLLFNIPKTAGTFVIRYLNEYLFKSGGYKQYEGGHGTIREYFIKEHDNFFKIGFIRNPFDWYVSRYFYLLQISKTRAAGVQTNIDGGRVGSAFLEFFPSLKHHLFWLHKNNHPLKSFKSHYDWFFFKEDQSFGLDFLGKVETLFDDFDKIISFTKQKPKASFREFHLKNKNDKKGLNSSDHLHYTNYYDEELISLINEWDSEILKEFDYEF